MQENESRLSECRNSIKEKQTSIIQFETELATVKIKSDPASVTKMFNVKKLMDGLKKEVNELRCVEQKLSKQLEMIQAPLSELGCEQAPPGNFYDKLSVPLVQPIFSSIKSYKVAERQWCNE